MTPSFIFVQIEMSRPARWTAGGASHFQEVIDAMEDDNDGDEGGYENDYYS
jgi:hypothetical protein